MPRPAAGDRPRVSGSALAAVPARGVLLLLVALAPGGRASATTIEIGPGDDLQAAVDALNPGDELVLRGGTYLLTSRFSIQAVGTPTRPIVVRAKDGETPVVQYVDGSQNVINVENAAHLVLRGLAVTGGSHGIRISASNFVTVERCHVHDVADVGISANVPGSDYRGCACSATRSTTPAAPPKGCTSAATPTPAGCTTAGSPATTSTTRTARA